jgi:type III secretion protein T
MNWASSGGVSSSLLLAMLITAPRILVCIFTLPMFPQSMFPTLLRTGISMGLAAPAAYGVFLQLDGSVAPLPVVALVIKEAVLGLLLGLALSAPFWVMDTVGSLTDNQRGANSAQQVTPFSQADASPVGVALQQALIATLAASGSFGLIYQLLLSSYEAWPALTLIPNLAPFGSDHAIASFAEFTQVAALYAAPMIIITLFVDFSFALIGIFAPELQSYFAAMPVKSLLGFLVLAVYLASLLDHGQSYFLRVIDEETRLLRSVVSAR